MIINFKGFTPLFFRMIVKLGLMSTELDWFWLWTPTGSCNTHTTTDVGFNNDDTNKGWKIYFQLHIKIIHYRGIDIIDKSIPVSWHDQNIRNLNR